MQRRHRDTENRHVDAAGREEESGMKWEIGIDMYAPPHAQLVASRKLLCRALNSGLRGDLEGWNWGRDGREGNEGRDMCTHVADSLLPTAETSTTLQSNYSPIKTI